MSLIELPKNDSPEAAEEAQRMFQAAIDDPLTVLMLVYGEGPDTRKIRNICCARALVKPVIRRVVWIPDPTVLSDEQRQKYEPRTSAAASVGIDDKIAKRLTRSRAKVKIYVERAFLAAESQGGE
ncbi:MAG: hypothetical protein ACYSWQ_20325 [Planctomycetota bacterium]